ncbi:MAG: 23S rRNA (guanosine(2251)-2'-O)-methyltransferase RlmB [Candidatus Coatesbacteria bacterium]|nr:MAG: 23S rRNA (guanosine(2251)-2'-O)-methyltransferase RlmB [Candidatus Coatesbacteria bacterium]
MADRRKKGAPYDVVVGRHSVLAAREAGTRAVRSVLIDRDARGVVVDDIRATAEALNVLVNAVSGRDIDKLARGVAHQGVAAYADKLPKPESDDLVASAEDGRPVVILDHIEDPHNVGAILRTCGALRAAGVVLAERRAAGITPAVVKAAAGALEYVPVLTVPNITAAISKLRSAGLWIYAFDADGEATMGTFEFAVPCAVVAGGEASGVSKRVRDACDAVVAIPLAPEVPSLNASVAAAVGLYEFRRQHPLGATFD